MAKKIGFCETYAVTGQTYTRKVDSQVIDVLSGIAQCAHKFATDLRLLQSRKEMEEPFEADQIGSSAMAYKRNPMERTEEVCALARYVMSLPSRRPRIRLPRSGWSRQRTWCQSSLGDPAGVFEVDAILHVAAKRDVGAGCLPAGYREEPARRRFPFMATKNIRWRRCQRGDRQDLHERCANMVRRRRSYEAGRSRMTC